MPELGYYIGFMVDVLGQGEKLSKIKSIPNNNHELKEVIQLLRETYGVVNEVKMMFESFYSTYLNSKPLVINPDHYDLQNQITQVKKCKIVKIGFSDTIIHLAPFSISPTNNPSYAVSALLHAAAVTMVGSLANRNPIRGSIEIGILLDSGNNEYYGPLFNSLNNLEKNAKWPRVVVGPELVKFIESAKHPSLSIDDDISRFYVLDCKKLISISDQPYLDIGNDDEMIKEKEIIEIYSNAFKFVLEELIKFESHEQIGPRYKLLHQSMITNMRRINNDNQAI